MSQGIVIAAGVGLSLTTSDSSNQIIATYDNIGAGKLKLYAKGSANTVLANLFVSGVQICRALPVIFVGTSGTIDTSANLVNDANTLGGRAELTFRATAATPTVDYQLNYEGIPLVGSAISKLFGR